MTIFQATFKRNKIYEKVYNNPDSGSFALCRPKGKPILWETCRENFALTFKENTKGLFFSHPPGKSSDIANFLIKFENIVQINCFQKHLNSVFRKTCCDTILWIEPSLFWLDCKIKRSLFTILLRCGINYSTEKDNFNDVLFGIHKENVYLKETKIALLRFMFGFTCWNSRDYENDRTKDERHGWREEFFNLDERKIKLKLLPPHQEPFKINMIGADSIWS